MIVYHPNYSRLSAMESGYPTDKTTADTTLQGETDTTYADVEAKIDALNTTLDSDIASASSSIDSGK